MGTTKTAILVAASTLLLGVGVGAAANEALFADKTERGFTIHTADSAPGMAETFEQVEAGFGFLPNMIAVMGESPALTSSYLATQAAISEHGSLTPAENNIVQLTVATMNECEYCTNGHAMMGEMMLGQDPAEVAQLKESSSIEGNAKHEALRAFTMAVVDMTGKVSDDELQAFFDAGYDRKAALDVIAAISAKTMSNFTNRLADTPLDDPIASYRDSR